MCNLFQASNALAMDQCYVHNLYLSWNYLWVIGLFLSKIIFSILPYRGCTYNDMAPSTFTPFLMFALPKLPLCDNDILPDFAIEHLMILTRYVHNDAFSSMADICTLVLCAKLKHRKQIHIRETRKNYNDRIKPFNSLTYWLFNDGNCCGAGGKYKIYFKFGPIRYIVHMLVHSSWEF